MITVLTLLYVAILFLAVKLKLIQLTLFWKLSPIIWMVILTIALFIPMQFYAPGGSVSVGQYSVQIVPHVTGEVIEVPVQANVPLEKGDVLFKINPVPYQAAVDDLEAQFELTSLRLSQAQRLAERGAGPVFDVETLTAQLAQVQAGLNNARFNLENTVVRAPSDGYVTNVALRIGARVAALPVASVMPFIETGEPILAMQIFQKDMRYIESGQMAEIAFKMFPGKVHSARVVHVLPASALGMQAPSGFAPGPQQILHAPMWVRLELEDASLLPDLRVGATGTGAIYTEKGAPTQIVRRVMVRMDAIINYLTPM